MTVPKYGDVVFSRSVMSYIYGEYSRELFEHSYLHIAFPDISFPDRFTKAQLTGIERGIRMLEGHLARLFGDDITRIRSLFPDVRLLKINDRYYLSKIPGTVALLSDKYDIELCAQAIRGHWSVENKLHWHLDYSLSILLSSFDEEQIRKALEAVK